MHVRQILNIYVPRGADPASAIRNPDYRCHYAINGNEGSYLRKTLRPLVLSGWCLQDTQERTRKRIKEDLKESGTAYNEFAEVMLPKLKNRYAKKYSEVEVCYTSH